MTNSKQRGTGQGNARRSAGNKEQGFLSSTLGAGRNQLKSTLSSVGNTVKKVRQKLLKK
ncbi:MAG: hypothetical protein K0S16_754 [Moraxellaceae bacterium]|jgi:hypothetical protein|nr:hypothetical protein [Moraxellaceae bacterium]